MMKIIRVLLVLIILPILITFLDKINYNSTAEEYTEFRKVSAQVWVENLEKYDNGVCYVRDFPMTNWKENTLHYVVEGWKILFVLYDYDNDKVYVVLGNRNVDD